MTQAAKPATDTKPTLEGLGAEIDELRGVVEAQGAIIGRMSAALLAAGYPHDAEPEPPTAS